MPAKDRYRCDICGKELKTWVNFQVHRQRKHTEEERKKHPAPTPQEALVEPLNPEDVVLYGCPYCDSTYETSDFNLLESHVVSCSTKRWNETEPEEGTIRAHMRLILNYLAFEEYYRRTHDVDD